MLRELREKYKIGIFITPCCTDFNIPLEYSLKPSVREELKRDLMVFKPVIIYELINEWLLNHPSSEENREERDQMLEHYARAEANVLRFTHGIYRG